MASKFTGLPHTLGGIKTLNRLRSVQEIDLAVLAGQPKVPPPATMRNHLGRVKLAGVVNVKLSTARALIRIGLIRGRAINIDVHITEHLGKERLSNGYHGTKEKAGRCCATMTVRIRKQGTVLSFFGEI